MKKDSVIDEIILFCFYSLWFFVKFGGTSSIVNK